MNYQREVEEVVSSLKTQNNSRAIFLIKSLFHRVLKETECRQKLEKDLTEQAEYINSLSSKLLDRESYGKSEK